MNGRNSSFCLVGRAGPSSGGGQLVDGLQDVAEVTKPVYQ